MSGIIGAPDVASVVRGNVESFDGRVLRGWASDATGEPLRLCVDVNGARYCEILANEPREDVIAAGYAMTGCGFSVEIPRAFFAGEPCLVAIFNGRNGDPIPGAPVRIEARPLEALDPKEAHLAGLADTIVQVIEKMDDVRQLQANVGLILTWLQKTVERANALRAIEAVRYDRLDEAIDALGGLRGSVGHLYGLIHRAYPQIVLPGIETPRVSIVIPTHDKFELTYQCVESIFNARTLAPYEIIVVDDFSSDETILASLVFMGGCKIMRTAENQGFVGACNLGWTSARGEFVLFLNNDTIVNDGWLDALVETLDRDPRIGVVGSRLLGADGLLQDAGGIIWRDGSGWNWGRGQDKLNPVFSFMRDADYVSGAALMIRHDLLKQLNGFDEFFAPAYYEDTDLCFRARAAGHRVVVQPKSTIVHLEGQSCGTSATSGLKRYQAINGRKFYNRWAQALADHALVGQSPVHEAERGVRKRALFIDETTPTPDQDAGSNAALGHILSLQRLGYKIVFLPAGNMANIPKYTEDLQALGIECWYAPYAWSVEEYFRRSEGGFDLVYIHRNANLQRYLGLVNKYVPDAQIVFNYADIHALRDLREAELQSAPTEKIAAIKLALNGEIDLASQVDAAIVHSSYEAEIIKQRQPEARVHCVPWTFKARTGATSPTGRSGIVFVGGFEHQPNVDAVDWFVENVWSASLACSHDFRIVGSKMPARFQRFVGANIDAVGHVADLDALLDKTLLTIAPLRYGAGLKGKVLSSLARGVPCVMTPVAAEGMNLPQAISSLIVRDAEAFARRIVELCENEGQWLALSQASLKFIAEKFSEAEVDRMMREMLLDAGRARKARDNQGA